MRIAQVAPLWERVPPLGYGGIELVVGLLTDELVRRGHEVVLFASGDSDTTAQLEPGCDEALRIKDILPPQYAIYEQMQLSKVFERASEFDIIHSHMDYATLPYGKFSKTPVVHTLHGIFTPLTEKIFGQHRQENFISISNSQRRPDLGLNYVATVYNAIAVNKFKFYAQPKHDTPYLAFLGRMSIEKGPHLAIEIAKRTGWHLKMAGKIDFANKRFFEEEVLPYIDGEQIEFLGEADHAMKNELMGNAVATLFPITWKEPFGLVMPESMACGTPLIALAQGSAPEVIADGKTGFLRHDVEGCIAALERIKEIDRRDCRRYVENKFSVQQMTDGYEVAYRQVLKERFAQGGRARSPRLVAS